MSVIVVPAGTPDNISPIFAEFSTHLPMDNVSEINLEGQSVTYLINGMSVSGSVLPKRLTPGAHSLWRAFYEGD